jgi:hypothetical protein
MLRIESGGAEDMKPMYVVWYTLPVLVYLLRSHIFQLYIVVHV